MALANLVPVFPIDAVSPEGRALDLHWADRFWLNHYSSIDLAEEIGVSHSGPITILPFRTSAFYHSNYPRGGNDGPVWQGRGLTAAGSGGARVDVRAGLAEVRAVANPMIWGTENRSFPLVPAASDQRYPFGSVALGIDNPQRFGESPVVQGDWGQSEISVAVKGLRFGMSSTNSVIGPAYRNPIILSANAPGVPRLFAEWRGNVGQYGRGEAVLFSGTLRASGYEAVPERSGNRSLSGISVSWIPWFWDDLVLGFHRTAMGYGVDGRGNALLELFVPYMSYRMGEDELDQRASVTAEWLFRPARTRLYLEWARNDFSSGYRQVMLFPQRTQAYTLGVQKNFVLPRSGGELVLRAEASQLAVSQDIMILGGTAAGFYSHHIVREGYTQDGQVIGASTGPGADVQFVGLTWHATTFSVGGSVERTSRNKDPMLLNASWIAQENITGFDAELAYEIAIGTEIGPSIWATAAVAATNNIAWRYELDRQTWAVSGRLGVRYSPMEIR